MASSQLHRRFRHLLLKNQAKALRTYTGRTHLRLLLHGLRFLVQQHCCRLLHSRRLAVRRQRRAAEHAVRAAVDAGVRAAGRRACGRYAVARLERLGSSHSAPRVQGGTAYLTLSAQGLEGSLGFSTNAAEACCIGITSRSKGRSPSIAQLLAAELSCILAMCLVYAAHQVDPD